MFSDLILTLSKQLYPKGRAFKMLFGGVLEKLQKGLALSEDRALICATSILSDILPDNVDFADDDAADWEKRLGLINYSSGDIENRKDAIIRKINFPGQAKGRQNWRFLEGQLQKAGFIVSVYENRFDDGMGGFITKTPLVFSGVSLIEGIQHGDFKHGTNRHGGTFHGLVANHIEEHLDAAFSIGDLRSTFFIGGSTPGSFASVPSSRKDEFRKLILTIKPVQTIGILLINYT